MDQIEQILTEHPFFKDISPAMLEKIRGLSTEEMFDADQYIIRAGQPANAFYIIEYGLVSLEIYVPNRGPVTVERIDDNDVLGWSWLYAPRKWQFDARAMEETRMLVIDADKFYALIHSDPQLGFVVFKRISMVMSHRLQTARRKMLEIYEIYFPAEKKQPGWHHLLD